MSGPVGKLARCAIYTRKSSEHNLDLAFSSLDAQREACEAYIRSQAHEGWRLILGRYDDGAFSGASLERPALQQLLADVRAGTIDIALVYKLDRLTRSLADFTKLIELFDAHGVSFVSVTQSFNTSSSMGRLTLMTRAVCTATKEPGDGESAHRKSLDPRGLCPLWSYFVFRLAVSHAVH
jgi:site-specific DNA recombinase